MVANTSPSRCFFISVIINLNVSKAFNFEAFLIKLLTRIGLIDSYLRFQKNFFEILLIKMLIDFNKFN